MSDIITRLLLKTDDFDAKLTRSKAGVNSYQNDVSSMAKTAGAGIAKFAGALGLAIGAGEGLMKVIQGSQATNDEFDNNMNACKDSVDAFFIALSTGDFSVFENGLLSVFSKAKELSAALDDIADKRLSIDLVDLRKQGEMTALEAIIRDTSKTKQERSDALSKYQFLAKEVAANRLDIAKEELTGNTNVELNKIGVKNLSQDDVTLYLEKLNNKDLNQQFLKELKYVSDYSKKYNEAWASVEKYRSRNGADAKSFQMEADFNNKWESPDKWMKRAFPNSEFKNSKQLMDFGKLFQQNDNGRTALYEYTKRLYEAENQNAADIRKLTKLKNSANAAVGGGKKEGTPLFGSLAYFDAEIAKKNKELSQATTMQARVAVQTTINELEARKLNLKISVDKSVFGQTHLEKDNKESSQIEELENTVIVYDNLISKKKEELSTEISESTHNSIKSEISKLKSTATEFNNLISTKKTQLSSETSETVRTTIESEIKELESTTAAFNALISTKQAELIEIASKSFQSPIQAEIEKLESTKINLRAEITVLKVEQGVRKMKSDILDGYNNNHRDDKGNRIDPDAFKNIKIPKVKSPISKKDIKLNNDYNESLTAMGDIMGSLSSTFDGNTASILQWGATLFATIGQAIPAIMGMIPAKKANAMASREEATAAALGAGAKSMEAHAGIPFAGIAIGLAGVASIIAVLSNMPKFATGGIVPGGSFAGDNVLARVNSGEMILNRVQQGNLFAALNSGVYGGITAEMVSPSPQYTPISRNIASGETNSKIELYGSVRVKGGDLEVALKNHTNKKSKVR